LASQARGEIPATASEFTSHAAFFIACVLLVVVWAPSYFVFQNLNTWQLIINTATTIVTFLIVFLIQNTQNRESQAVQLKLDALILASSASNQALDLEDISDDHAAEML
jgi:low affinity Fe/Cu permease